MQLKHAHQVAAADNPDRDVSASEWNADHVITGAAYKLLGIGADGNGAEFDHGAFNVKWDGVVGDGTTDDTANLQADITGNRHVYLPAADVAYALTAITIPANTLVQTGGVAAALHQRGAADGARIVSITGSNSAIGDMAFTGQIATNTGEQNHGLIAQGNAATGSISVIRAGNLTGTDMRGDVAYIGQTGTNLGAATVTIASPAVVTRVAHGLAANTEVMLSTTGALPTGLSPNTAYYVRNPTSDTFQLSATRGGASINTGGSQSGTHTLFDISGRIEQVSLGHLRGTNVLRNVLTCEGGRAIDVASVIATGGNGLDVIDLETNAGSGRISGIRIAYGRGQYAGIIGTTAADLCEGVDIGMLDLDPSYGTDTTPPYGASRSDGLLVRNTRSAKIGTFRANGFSGQAIQHIYNAGELDQSNLKIGYARLTDSCKTDTTYNSYIQGAQGHSNLNVDFLDITLMLATHIGISNADNTIIGAARATVPAGGIFIAASNDGVVGSLQQQGGIAFSNCVRQLCLGGVFNGQTFFNNCTQSVGISCNVTASVSALNGATSSGFLFSTIGGVAYDLFTGFITIKSATGDLTTNGAIRANGNSTIGYNVGSGGAVAQTTSRSTALPAINKPSGKFTLVSGTTTAGQLDSFTLTNSALGANDTISFTQLSGAGFYIVNAINNGNGTATVKVYTPIAVGVAEAPSFQFNIVHGAAS